MLNYDQLMNLWVSLTRRLSVYCLPEISCTCLTSNSYFTANKEHNVMIPSL